MTGPLAQRPRKDYFVILHDLEQLIQHLGRIPDRLGDKPNLFLTSFCLHCYPLFSVWFLRLQCHNIRICNLSYFSNPSSRSQSRGASSVSPLLATLYISTHFDRIWHKALISKRPSCNLISSFLYHPSIAAVVDVAVTQAVVCLAIMHMALGLKSGQGRDFLGRLLVPSPASKWIPPTSR